MQTYSCSELNTLTKELTGSYHASVSEAGKEIADLLAASHNTLQARGNHCSMHPVTSLRASDACGCEVNVLLTLSGDTLRLNGACSTVQPPSKQCHKLQQTRDGSLAASKMALRLGRSMSMRP